MKEQQAIQKQEEAMRQAEQERLQKELKVREEKRKKEKEREEKRKNVSDRLEMIRKTEIGQKMLGNIELEVSFHIAYACGDVIMFFCLIDKIFDRFVATHCELDDFAMLFTCSPFVVSRPRLSYLNFNHWNVLIFLNIFH